MKVVLKSCADGAGVAIFAARLVQIAGYPLDNRSSAVLFIEIFSNYIQRNYLEERILT